MSSDVRKQFGLRLQQLRHKREWSQVTMADLLGIDRSHLSKIENGLKDPGLVLMKRIADGLDMTLIELLRGVED